MKKTVLAALMFAALIVLLVPTLATAEGGERGWLYRDRLEIGRALIEVQSTNWPEIIPYYTHDIEYHDAIVDIYGIETMTAFFARMFANSPNLVTTIEDETLIGGTYTASWTMAGDFAGVPYEAKGVSIIKFRGWTRKVYYQRDYYTEGDIMASIPGLDEAIWGFRTYYRCAVDPTFDCPLAGTARYSAPELSVSTDSASPDDEAEARGRGLRWLRRRRMEIGRSLVEINADNWQSLLQYYAPDIEYHDPIVDIYGFETMVEFLGRLYASSPNLVTTVEDETLLGGIYMATWTMTGDFDGVPFSAKGMSVVKFGRWSTRVKYSRDYYTEGDIMINIPGLDEAVQGFRVFYRCAVDPTFDCPLEGQALAGLDGDQSRSDVLPSVGGFKLEQNVPNPFNPVTEIAFQVPSGGAEMSLRIYDVSGRLVRTLVDGYEPSGARSVSWDGTNDTGEKVASGMYTYRLTSPSFTESRKMLLLK